MWPNREGSCFQLEANKKKLPILEAPSSAAYFYGMRNIAINLENERREEKREERGADPKPIDQPRKSIGGGGERLALPLTDRQIGPDSVLHFPPFKATFT